MRGYTLLLFAIIIGISQAFYLPGVVPREYEDGDQVELKVNKLTSIHTQLPYKYYALPFCRPDVIEDARENLGEILIGDRIESSAYQIYAGKDEACKVLCVDDLLEKKDIQFFSDRIAEEYSVHWIVDNLPSATRRTLKDASGNTQIIYENGFALGESGKSIEGGVAGINYINNHVNIRLLYHMAESFVGRRIVGFEVEPESVAHSLDFDVKDIFAVPSTCARRRETPPMAVDPTKEKEDRPAMVWTYSVLWQAKADVKWASRWDAYLLMTDPQIHWFSIINSLLIVFFLTGMVAMIMMRTLHADLRRYQEMDSAEEAHEETGWKLVHGDVFRPPSSPMLLSVLVGTGVQVTFMGVITMFFAVAGFLSPANRGALMTAMVVLFMLMGVFAGYFSARCYKMFKGQHWKKNTILTSMLFFGVVFVILVILNIALSTAGSSGVLPLKTMIALIALWFALSVPLVFLGSYFGFKKPAPEQPVRTNQIPRQIPEQVWYMRPIYSILMGGILPFGAIFIELFFILSSIWLHQFYYLFGFLFIVFFILVATCAEITIVMCYFQLCSEDYHWWWRSFLTSGASALYMFLYSIFYFSTKLEITKPVSSLLFFGYTFIMTFGFFVLTGSIGFYACYFFVRKIYGSVKVA